ncbi:hypothetical protein L21_2157 [Methanoculleus chikugoensis]|uniref:DUF86 domain-containing protein n=1 Tax=Methanoculleus chikugoensis TaxID=118126 RepID=A0A1M4MMS2_9EURY|nr:DUF86 domain-containing protein [Methanoculleus chikugoensis]MDD4568417.1 DUF86 domain-containing protein [Methanoculleus chikugoensis]SCL76234.1 hypothetical protein L21_2157 [Methanoculleus chikugoensis]
MTAPRSALDYLDDILDAIEKIEIFTRGMSHEEFSDDDKTVYAVMRALEVIGEATKCIPPEIRESCPSLPWTEMAGMRDKLIHTYFGINRAIIWRTIQDDIPLLRPGMQALRDGLAAEENRDQQTPDPRGF